MEGLHEYSNVFISSEEIDEDFEHWEDEEKLNISEFTAEQFPTITEFKVENDVDVDVDMDISLHEPGVSEMETDFWPTPTIAQVAGEFAKVEKSKEVVKDGKSQCKICFKWFSKNYMRTHKLYHSEKRSYKCKFCPSTFKAPSGLGKHHRKLHPNIARIHSCMICNFKSYNYDELRAHNRSVHSISKKRKVLKTRQSQETLSNNNFAKKPIIFQIATHPCEICSKFFKTQAQLKLHVNSVHLNIRAFQCSMCPKGFNSSSHLKSHFNATHLNLREFQCQLCPKAFKSRDGLNYHIKIHTGEKPFKCEVCSQRFICSKALRYHTKRNRCFQIKGFSKYLGSKPTRTATKKTRPRSTSTALHSCHICKKQFKRSGKLKTHFNAVHLGMRPFQCQLCPKSFKSRAGLQYHTHVHSGEWRFKCEICDRGFINSTRLKLHVKSCTTRPLSNEPPPSKDCKLCLEPFNSLKNLNLHLKLVHSILAPYQCPLCPRSFSTSQVLKNHSRSHTGETPYKCHLCPRSFTHSSSLRYHVKAHELPKKIRSGLKKRKKSVAIIEPKPCKLCQESFGTLKALRIHLKEVHSILTPFECPMCPKSFTNSTGFKYHVRTHTGEKPYTCDRCPEKFISAQSLRAHIETKKCRRFPCEFCPKGFFVKSALDYHTRAAHTGEKPYDCKICGAKYVCGSGLKYHINAQHQPVINLVRMEIKRESRPEGVNSSRFSRRLHMSEKPHQCDLCPQGFLTESSLKFHIRSHNTKPPSTIKTEPGNDAEPETAKKGRPKISVPQNCKHCPRVFETVKALHNHLRNKHSINKPYQCEMCPLAFKSGTGLKYHIRWHTGERPFECEVCFNRFISAHNLKSHSKVHSSNNDDNTGEKDDLVKRYLRRRRVKKSQTVENHPCKMCSETFTSFKTLGHHLKSVHLIEKPFDCKLCDKSFRSRQYLNHHILAHTGERPYKCPTCPKGFITAYELKIHSRSHDSSRMKLLRKYSAKPIPQSFLQLGEKQFQCKICSRILQTKASIGYHVKTHTGERPFKCHDCQKGFITGYDLKIHAKTHDPNRVIKKRKYSMQSREVKFLMTFDKIGENQYQCKICSAILQSKGGCRYHSRTHTGEKPYKCSLCDQGFISSQNLKSHVKSHDPNWILKRKYSRRNREEKIPPSFDKIDEKQFQCKICSAILQSRNSLIYHSRIHTGEKPYKCPECDQGFIAAHNLRNHMKSHDRSRIKNFGCHLCPEAYRYKKLLNLHLTSCHPGAEKLIERSFIECYFCGDVFKSMQGFKYHLRGHTGERPFSCLVCRKSFKSQNEIFKHFKKHTEYDDE